MIARLLISKSLGERIGEIERRLADKNLSPNHPDLLYFPYDSKLGIAEARKIKEHFSLKPYSAKGRAVVMEDASTLTHEAQNALLKTLEEPPPEALLILAAPSDAHFLPTILSRCQVIQLPDSSIQLPASKFQSDVDKLLTSSVEERFEYIEKLKDREEFLHLLTRYFREQLHAPRPGLARLDTQNFLKELLQAEEWAEANVNIRAILEYLMIIMPKNKPIV